MPIYNALIAGIGGQGVISLGTLFKRAALKAGIHVSGSERRGGAQREGHVASIIRYRWSENGQRRDDRHEVCSPLLCAGTAHLLIGLEPLEAVRVARYLNEESTVILNSFPQVPVPVKLGEAEYPRLDTIIAMLERFTKRVGVWDLTTMAREKFGNLRATNAITLGISAAVAGLPVTETHLLAALEEEGRPGDKECFRLGVKLGNAWRK